MLCPGALQFAQSSVVLYKWDCICNRYIRYDFNFLNYTFHSFFFPDVLNKTASSIDEAPFFLVPNRTCIPQLLSWIMRSGRRQAWEHREITGTAMESLPAAARRVNQWVRKRTSNCWNYDTNCREAVAHFMITDDLKKN